MEPITAVLLFLYTSAAAAALAGLAVRRRFRRELEVILASADVAPDPVVDVEPDHPFIGRMVVVNVWQPVGVGPDGKPVVREQAYRGILRDAGRWYVLTSASLAHEDGSTVTWQPLPYEWAVEAERVGMVQLDASEEAPKVPAEPSPADD